MNENKENVQQGLSLDLRLLGATTIIKVASSNGNRKHGTGFYYINTDLDDSKMENGWRTVDDIWLITNKHVVFDNHESTSLIFPESLTFALREVINNKIEWFFIELDKEEIKKRIKTHQDPITDVVAIRVDDIIIETQQKFEKEKRALVSFGNITNLNLPNNSPINIEVTSDIIVASYPMLFYDTYNKFPIIKSGIIASMWGGNFNGNRCFLIDSQLFSGSSGGLVISQPTNFAMIKGMPSHSPEKQYVLLGVYSGQYHREVQRQSKDNALHDADSSFGLGIVWYSNLIPEIINS